MYSSLLTTYYSDIVRYVQIHPRISKNSLFRNLFIVLYPNLSSKIASSLLINGVNRTMQGRIKIPFHIYGLWPINPHHTRPCVCGATHEILVHMGKNVCADVGVEGKL